MIAADSLGYPIFAFIMVCHGMQYFDMNLPTTINRILTILFMSIMTFGLYILQGFHYTNLVGLFILAGFALWVIPGWMPYISACIGHEKIPRWAGLLQMTARQALIVPLIAGLCYITGSTYWPCVGFLFMGLPYYINGYLLKGRLERFQVIGSHAIVGMIIWGMVCATLSLS